MSTIASGGFNPAKTKTQNLGNSMQMLAQANKMGENKVNAFGQMLQGASDIGKASNTNKLNQFLSDFGGLSAEETRAGASQFGTVSDQAEKALHRNVESKSLTEKRQHQEDLQKARQVFQGEESDKRNAFQASQTDVKAGNSLNELGQRFQNNISRDEARIDYKNSNPTMQPMAMGDGFFKVGNDVYDAKGLAEKFGITLPEQSVSNSQASSAPAPIMDRKVTGNTARAMEQMNGNNRDIAQNLYNTGNFNIVKGKKDPKTKRTPPDKFNYGGTNYASLQDASNAMKREYTLSPDAIAQLNEQGGFNFGQNISPNENQTDNIREAKPENTTRQKQGFEKLQEEAEDRRSGFMRKLLGFGNYDNRTK